MTRRVELSDAEVEELSAVIDFWIDCTEQSYRDCPEDPEFTEQDMLDQVGWWQELKRKITGEWGQRWLSGARPLGSTLSSR